MRPFAHSFRTPRLWALTALCALGAAALHAQTVHSTTPGPATPPSPLNPSAPSLPLVHQPLQPSGAIATDTADWRAANAAVAAFPRGHADVLRWEAAQAAPHPAPAAAAPHHHGGQP